MFGFSVMTSLIVGMCISITAEGTTARVLMEINRIRSRVGAAIMDAGIIDDIIGLSLFIWVSYMLKESFVKDDLLIAGAILAFFTGIILQAELRKKQGMLDSVRKAVIYLIAPFFFVSVGVHFDILSVVSLHALTVIILLAAATGKILGVIAAKPFTSFSWRQLHLIGWGMNSRGAVGIALARIAFRTGHINSDIYSGLVLTTLVTTLVFPVIIMSMVKRDPKIMD